MPEFLLPAIVALATVLGTGLAELERCARRGADVFTLFLVIVALQCLVPIAGLSLYFLFARAPVSTGNEFFDRVYSMTGPVELSLVAAFALLFVAFSYLGFRFAFERLRPVYERASPRSLGVDPMWYSLVVALGLLAGSWLLLSFGSGWFGGYRSLVQFRNLDPNIERNFVNANLFSLTQTFLFIGMLAPFVMGRDGRFSRAWPFWILIVAVLASFGVSRRALFIPVVFLLFVVLLRRSRVSVVGVALTAVFSAIVVMLGKAILADFAAGAQTIEVDRAPLGSYFLLFVSDLGITVVESLATLASIDLPYRFGIDHLFSVLRRIPSGMMGFESAFLPERIVRYSTEVFLGPDAPDVPPGLFGQMWLDFGVLGPALYGIFTGVVLGWVEALRRSFRNDWSAAALFALLVFVLALPINTGSLDFTFSVDIFALVFLCVLFLRVRREPATRMATPP